MARLNKVTAVLYGRLEKIAEQARRGYLTLAAADRMMSEQIEAAHGFALSESWDAPMIDARDAYRKKYRLLLDCLK